MISLPTISKPGRDSTPLIAVDILETGVVTLSLAIPLSHQTAVRFVLSFRFQLSHYRPSTQTLPRVECCLYLRGLRPRVLFSLK